MLGLMNRRAFFDSGEAWFSLQMRRNKAVHVVMLDLDHFKKINDSAGHDFGDIALKSFAGQMISQFPDAYCARIGGEEFVMLLDGKPREIEKLESFRHLISETAISDGLQARQLTVTIGIASGIFDSLDLALATADRALYEGKAEGRNRVVVRNVS